jgi:leucyl-tRNA synthetase
MPKIVKADMKKAMAFIQGLKKRLVAGEEPQTVFDRNLAFDELNTLREMVPGLKPVDAGRREP